MMNPDQWRQIEMLYQAALERDAIERAAFLDEACAGNEELRLEVESLLVADEEAKKSDDFLNQNALQVAARAIAQDQNQSLVGRKVGRYQILSLLGAGGMGEVYLAQDPRLGRKLAFKFLPQEFTRNPERVQRFAREARAASALNHPNIITIHEMGEVAIEDGSLRYIVTEYVEGETLRQRMASAPQQRIEPSEAIDIAMQIAAALSAAHEAGITHRDIKPENVMVRPDGLVKVLDFGLAKLMTPPPETIDTDAATLAREMRTTPGIILGTLRYISPEQARGRDVDARSDIFSLGAVLYEMITGEALFAGETTADIIAAIINKEPEPLERYVREAPAELARIVRKALAKDREQRYQAAKDLLIGLKNLKLELELADKLKQTELSATPNEAGERQPTDEDAISALTRSYPAAAANAHNMLEPVGGAMPLGSKYYITRPTDEEFRAAIARQDSIVLIKGARQVGKTSLLARGLQQARAAGAKVVLTDLQKLNSGDLASAEAFYLALADLIADQLSLDVAPDAVWNARRGPSINFERYVRREALGKISAPMVWGLDEVDRLFTCSFGSEVFGLFRSWHNERSLDPAGPWQRLTMAIAYATEAHLFITDMNQSPFNVGTRLMLEDFTHSQVADLNERYGSPLKNEGEVARYYRLVSGHPYLVRCGLQEMVVRRRDLSALEAIADRDDGPFGDHLRRIIASLEQDPSLCEVARGILQGQPCLTQESFYRLRSAGLFAGSSARDVRPRCQLYSTYLKKRLL